MRASALKQISSLGVVLPHDDKVSSPPKIIPIVFLPNKKGTELKKILQSNEPVKNDSESLCLPLGDLVSSLVFVSRNYDGSELYYFVTYLTYSEINTLNEFINEQKGGILL